MARARKAGGLYWPPIVAALTILTFIPALSYPFLNWDDVDVFVRNDALRAPGLLKWAFTTRYMEHYQPLAWLAWGALERTVGLTPATAHALNVALHAACAALVFVLARAGVNVGPYDDQEGDGRGDDYQGVGRGRRLRRPEWAAFVAALLFAVHPLRVEPVVWASAMPYSLALLCALLSTLAWMHGRWWTSAALFALSLLARPIALGLPLVLAILEPAEAGPHEDEKRRVRLEPMWGPASAGSLRRLIPHASAALAAATMESSARLTASLSEFGTGPRLTLAAAAPFVYLWRTIYPVGLTPLDPLARVPRTEPLVIVLGLAGIALVSWAAWRWRRRYPVLAAAWVGYLALLVPAVGLVPSGLQATADRYAYLPAVPVTIALAWCLHSAELQIRSGAAKAARYATTSSAELQLGPGAAKLGPGAAKAARYGTVLVMAIMAALTLQQTRHWRDSIALWTRAVEIDPRNDVALYNLGTALAEAGRRDEALARYEQVLAVAPDHAEALRNRNLAKAAALEEDGNALAAAGNLEAATARYADAVLLDPRRSHSHAALGMALAELGRFAAAEPHLRIAIEQGNSDPAVAAALAYVREMKKGRP